MSNITQYANSYFTAKTHKILFVFLTFCLKQCYVGNDVLNNLKMTISMNFFVVS